MTNVPDSTLELIYQDIVQSLGYKTTVGPTDKSKVERRYAGLKTELPSARLAKAAWRTAALLKPINGPPPPPPPYKKVAPRVAYAVAGADARYCVFNQPGVWRQDDGTYRDEIAIYSDEGLCLGAERSGGPAVTAANDINGRPYCTLPTTGDPTRNTGSWAI